MIRKEKRIERQRGLVWAEKRERADMVSNLYAIYISFPVQDKDY